MFARALMIALLVSTWLTGCEKPSHENIDKWVTTRKGPEKLKSALKDDGLDPDLSAHAAAAMIKKRPPMDADVRAAFDKMSDGRRTAVGIKLVPRLWEIARVEGENEMPNAQQVIAKDMLVILRKWVDEPTKQQIDAYLTDWFGVRSYVGRAKTGATFGPVAIRIVGAPLGKRLMEVTNAVIAEPGQGSGAGQSMNVINDELLLGLAATGTPETVKYILDIARMDRGDKTLATRCLSALYRAYVKNENEFDLVPPAALVPNLDALVGFAKDDASENRTINDAMSLIRAAGMPHCKAPLVSMIPTGHRSSEFKYVAASNALACAGPGAIVEVVHALPPGSYDKERLYGGVAIEISKLQPKAAVLAALRELLADKATLSKWVAIETLAILHSAEDAAAVAALATSKEPLTGYWGDNPDNKPTPTLGQRAQELAPSLK